MHLRKRQSARRGLSISSAFVLFLLSSAPAWAGSDESGREARLLGNLRQLTFEGRRSGEGYFDAQGRRLIFQSEREPDNPFYQIYVMDLENGDVDRVSPGIGKTTCGFFEPASRRVLFASTHKDPQAEQKQKDEISFRASGRERRYAWDYDENFDLYSKDLDSQQIRRLTDARGYDAEGSYSPDGRWIVFSSNRHAYRETLSAQDQERFAIDKSYMADIYRMASDGSDLRRLTNVKGYDGGPFFSPDGKRIIWRRFSEDGLLAEIYTMNVDGSDAHPITHLGAMSWAPYFHPSGRYVIFTTNKHGFANFELYLVDAEGRGEPIRVTETDGFDGLPVFSPNGRRLAWTSNRASGNKSQIFMADWNHKAALALLGVVAHPLPADLPETDSAVQGDDVRKHVEYLASEALEGRLTGTPGEKAAADYLARYFESLGLAPAGSDGFFQDFEFTSGVSLGAENRLAMGEGSDAAPLELEKDWRPLGFSSDKVLEAGVVFAGYGLTVAESGDQEEYDSYVHLDVKDKWVLVLRFLPEDIAPERRRHLLRNSALPFKAITAREKGAKGLIVVSGPGSKVRHQLVSLQENAMGAESGIAAVSVTDPVAAQWFEKAGESLAEIQKRLDKGDAVMGFAIPDLVLSGRIHLEKKRSVGRNVLAKLPADGGESGDAVLIGAHYDHLGHGKSGGSRALPSEEGAIHYGADDNASGTAGVLEIAEYLAHEKSAGRIKMKRDAIFAAWSGEELGLVGSGRYVERLTKLAHTVPSDDISAYLNMDMIGRLRDSLVLQGVGSSSIWPSIIERRNAPVGLSLTLQQSAYLPTDATSFYLAGIPVLSAFTGSHEEYHSPRDTAERLDYAGAERVVRFMSLVARDLIQRDQPPEYVTMKAPESGGRGGLRAYLGTVPDYAQGDVPGVRLSGVAEGSPAAAAGLKRGDVIVELAGKRVENIYDYTYAIDALKIGEAVGLAVVREGKRVQLKITPASRK